MKSVDIQHVAFKGWVDTVLRGPSAGDCQDRCGRGRHAMARGRNDLEKCLNHIKKYIQKRTMLKYI